MALKQSHSPRGNVLFSFSSFVLPPSPSPPGFSPSSSIQGPQHFFLSLLAERFSAGFPGAGWCHNQGQSRSAEEERQALVTHLDLAFLSLAITLGIGQRVLMKPNSPTSVPLPWVRLGYARAQ